MLYSRQFEPPQANPPVRHRCRNPKCGGKLKPAVTNSRDAFCSPGCFKAFYRRHCLVCERPIIRQTERQQLCGRYKCKHDFQRHKERFLPTRYLASVLAPNASRSAHFTGLKIGQKPDRPFRIAAGPKLGPRGLQLASLPLDPDLVVRLERAHRSSFENRRKAKRTAVRKALIKRHHPPVNVLGGYRFPRAPAVDLFPLPEPTEWAVPSRWQPALTTANAVPDIPEFLRRQP